MPLWIHLYFCALLAVLGAVLASFLCCAAERRARGESAVRGRSHCDACGHVLGPAELVPVFSYLFCRGKCRHCGAKIPPLCLGAELAGAAAFALVGARFGLTLAAAQWLIFAALLLALSLTDAVRMILPDGLLLCCAANRLVWVLLLREPLWPAARTALISCAVPLALLLLSLLLDRLLGKETLGGGDIKLLAVMALYLSLPALLLALLAGCVLGLIAAVCGKKRRGEPLPFGPFLAAGCLLSVCLGGGLIQWYLGLL